MSGYGGLHFVRGGGRVWCVYGWQGEHMPRCVGGRG